MSGFGEFMNYALFAVFMLNVVFDGLSDTSLTLAALRKPSKLWAVSAMVSLFSVLNTITIYPIDSLVKGDWLSYMPLRGIILSASAILWYLMVGGLLRKIDSVAKSVGNLIAPAALSGAVMAMPLVLANEHVASVWGAIGLAVSSGLGFALASWLIYIGMKRMNHPDVPKFLQGAPIMLIYIGLLSLLFSAFGN